MATIYKIHPAIGTARVGNSAEYYLAPETPGGLPLDRNTGKPIYTGPGVPPQNIYHDAAGALKKQAARFKVFAYDNANPADPGTRVQVGTTKVNGKTVTSIEWTVYLANKKAGWFQFEQLTGSGMEGDAGYNKNNANNAKGNPLRFSKAGAGMMPRLAGDNPLSDVERSNFLTLTATQFFILGQYAKGTFSQSAAPARGEGIALDQASLENCVGGAFCPGIEMTWICRDTTIYMPLPSNPSLSDAFGLRHKDVTGGLTLSNGANNDYSAGLEPGDIIKYMAQPWQADSNLCSVQPIPSNGPNYWWWPAQRPYSVFAAQNPAQQVQWTRKSDDPNAGEFTDLQMVANWKTWASSSTSGPPPARASLRSSGTRRRSPISTLH
jgi:hypothetical protein